MNERRVVWLSHMLPAPIWFLSRLIFDPEDGSHTFLRNIGSHTDYAAQYPRRW
jgi:hypothetical protein